MKLVFPPLPRLGRDFVLIIVQKLPPDQQENEIKRTLSEELCINLKVLCNTTYTVKIAKALLVPQLGFL